MNLHTAAIAVTVLMFSLVSSTEGRQKPSASDEAEITKLVSMLEAGWNAGDGRMFAAPFAEDADYVVINGKYIKGREAIARGHQDIFDTIYKNTRIKMVVESVRFLRNNVAIARLEARLMLSQNREHHARATLVLAKEKGKWSIVAFQNTQIADEQSR